MMTLRSRRSKSMRCLWTRCFSCAAGACRCTGGRHVIWCSWPPAEIVVSSVLLTVSCVSATLAKTMRRVWSKVASLVFSPRFHVSLFKFWPPMVVDTERGARNPKKKFGRKWRGVLVFHISFGLLHHLYQTKAAVL